ncbi:MAG TPA: LysM domain-containing protein [Verrucomicrobiae bacterium]|nr:LysM domain-containing protein [Verrucomicrobiae bacterium]
MKFAFFCVVGVHVAALMVALLSQGCKRDQTTALDTTSPTYNETNLPALPLETNPAYVAPSNVPPVLVAPPGAPQPQEHVIRKGDAFSTLAKKFGVSAKAIQEANPGVDPLKLQIGQKINIPPPSAVPVATPTGQGVAPVDATGEVIYVVKSGDRLEVIARKYGITAQAIADANNLKTVNKIVVGQKLKIPVKTPPPAPVGTAPPAVPPAR